MQLDKAVFQWTGFTGEPGYSVFYSEHGSFGVRDALQNFFATFKAFLAPGVIIHSPASGFVIDETTGAIVDTWSTSAPTNIVSSGAGKYSAPSGAVVSWQTGTIHGRRVMQGRTFLVPLMGDAYDTDGTLLATCVTAIDSAATTLRGAAAPHLGIYARGSATVAGKFGPIIGHRVPDKAAVLRSRRG